MVLLRKSWFLNAIASVFFAAGLFLDPLSAHAQTATPAKPQTPPSAASKNNDKPARIIPAENAEEWLAKFKTQGWAKCRMSAVDTFGVTAGKATTEVFVAIRQLTDGMEEVEKLLEQRGTDNRALKSALQAEAHLISVMTLEQKGSLFKECVQSLW
jgi:hypothetical protein